MEQQFDCNSDLPAQGARVRPGVLGACHGVVPIRSSAACGHVDGRTG